MSKIAGCIFIVVQDGRKRTRREYRGGMNWAEMKVARARLAGRRWRSVRFEDWDGNVLDLAQFPASPFFGQDKRIKSSSGEIREKKAVGPEEKSDEEGAGLPAGDCPEAWDSGL